MNISPTEAADALRDIQASADQAREFKGYRLAAPHFFLWGTIWIIGYGASGLSPVAGRLWLPLTVIGIVASAFIGWRNRGQKAPGSAGYGRRMWLTSIAFALFITATYAILPPHTANQMNAFPALLTGMAYALAGVWSGRRRLVMLGAVVAAATMVGYFFLAPWFAFWMAAVGGGGLILTGFWMRKA
jgi:hypothetical protein